MFACYICSANSDTVDKLHLHLQRHECAGELTLPIRCLQENCTSTFHSLWNLKRHVNNFHKLSKNVLRCSSHRSNSIDCSVISDDTCDDVLQENRQKRSMFEVHQQGVSLVASLRSNSAVPNNVVCHVVQSINQITQGAVDYLKQQILEPLQAIPDLSPALLSQFEESLSDVERPLDFLSSRYKQDNYFAQHPLFVASETVSLGSRYECQHGENRLVYNTYEYVSVEKNVRSLLHNKDFVELLLAERPCDPDVLSSFADGERCKQHSLFNDPSRLSLKIQLFYDGMGTVNPLRAQSSTCNVGVFYYTLQNIPPSHNSCFANVHLLAICYSLDLKTYGYIPVLERFVAEMQKLQTIGFSGNFPLIGSRQVYVGLAQVCCDNLALNGLFGCLASLSALAQTISAPCALHPRLTYKSKHMSMNFSYAQ